MSALVWASMGIILMVAEMMSGTFILLFFGVAALVVSLAKFFGLANWTIEVLMFGGIGMLMTLVFRKKIKASFSPTNSYELEQSLRLSAPIPANGEAKVEYQGSLWSVVNTTNADMIVGQTVQVEKTEGVKLYVKNI